MTPDAAPLSEEELAEMRRVGRRELTISSWAVSGWIARLCTTIAMLTADKAALEAKQAELCTCLEWEQSRATTAEADNAALEEEYALCRKLLVERAGEKTTAEASLAVVVDALTSAHGALQQAYTSKRLARLDAPTRTRLQSASWAIAAALASIPTAAQDLLERVRRARTPGTRE